MGYCIAPLYSDEDLDDLLFGTDEQYDPGLCTRMVEGAFERAYGIKVDLSI